MAGQRSIAALGALIALGLTLQPASATIYNLKLTGTVQTVEGDAIGSGIHNGDAINAAFQFDDATAYGLTLLSLGGGTYSNYSAPLTAVSLAIGSYTVNYANYVSTLVYMDNSFGSDGIVFGLDGLPGGPFGSTFTDVQLQARGPSSAIDGSGLNNGLPYSRFSPSFFAVFGNGATAERVFGSLTISEAAAVPEPATWTLLITGMGLAGSALRRRRRSQHVAACAAG